MGVLDLPAPALSWLDQHLAGVGPPAVNVAIWAMLCALLCMEVYRLLSPQGRIGRIKTDLRAAQARLNAFDGAFADAWPLIGRMLSLALRRIALVLPATLAASLPVLFIVVWLEGRHGEAYPPDGAEVHVEVSDGYRGEWRDAGAAAPGARIVDASGRPIADVTLPRPVSEVHKRRWWNVIMGNPAGYLADSLPFDSVRFALPRDEVLPFGPSWLRGWEPVFFAALLTAAALLKHARRIE